MKIIIIFLAFIMLNSCGDNSPEPIKELECGLEYIIRTDVSGQVLEYGTLRDTNDWKTFANQNAKGMENEFAFQYATPNPISFSTLSGFELSQISRVKLYFQDSLYYDIYAQPGAYSIELNLKNYKAGCYNIKAECYLGQTENSPISNRILTSSGRVMVVVKP